MADTATEHLRAAREVLVQKRRDLDQQINELSQLIAKVGPYESPVTIGDVVVTTVTTGGTNGGNAQRTPTIRDAVWQLLSDGQDWRVPEILNALATAGIHAQDASLRSILSKMVKDNLLEIGDRGYYHRRDMVGVPTKE